MIHDDSLPPSQRSRRRRATASRPIWAGLAVALAFVFVAPSAALAERCHPDKLYRDYWHNRNIFDTMTRAEKRQMPLPRQVARQWTNEKSKIRWRRSSFAEFDIWWRTGALLKIRTNAWRAKIKRSRAKQRRFDACKERNRKAAKKAKKERAAREVARKKKMYDEYFAKQAKYYTKGEIMCLNRNCRQCKGGRCVPVGKLGDLHKNPAICPGTDDSKDLKDNRSLCRDVRGDRERAANPRPKRRRRGPPRRRRGKR